MREHTRRSPFDAFDESCRRETRRLLASKFIDFASISNAAKVMLDISTESTMHVSFCAQFGVTLEELETTPESPATTAYGAYLLNIGIQGT